MLLKVKECLQLEPPASVGVVSGCFHIQHFQLDACLVPLPRLTPTYSYRQLNNTEEINSINIVLSQSCD